MSSHNTNHNRYSLVYGERTTLKYGNVKRNLFYHTPASMLLQADCALKKYETGMKDGNCKTQQSIFQAKLFHSAGSCTVRAS